MNQLFKDILFILSIPFIFIYDFFTEISIEVLFILSIMFLLIGLIGKIVLSIYFN